jgi:hypothetical protein
VLCAKFSMRFVLVLRMRPDACIRTEDSTDSRIRWPLWSRSRWRARYLLVYFKGFRSSELESGTFCCGLGEAQAGRARHAVHIITIATVVRTYLGDIAICVWSDEWVGDV